MLYILKIFLYYFIQGLKSLIKNGNSPRQRDFLCVKFTLFVLLPLRLTTHKKKIINQCSTVRLIQYRKGISPLDS